MYSEADTRANYIAPALKAAYWQPNNIIKNYSYMYVDNFKRSDRAE